MVLLPLVVVLLLMLLIVTSAVAVISALAVSPIGREAIKNSLMSPGDVVSISIIDEMQSIIGIKVFLELRFWNFFFFII